jgi:hypothetical protein
LLQQRRDGSSSSSNSSGSGVGSSSKVTRHNTPIRNILSTAPQLIISQKALGTLPDDGNVMPKHVGSYMHNKLNE